jgi:hypothetical protein
MGAVTAAPRTAMLCAQLLLAAVPGMSAPVIGRASRGPQPRAEGLASASAYVPQGGPRAPLMMDADGNLYRPDGVKVPTDAGGMPIAGVGAFPLLSDLHRAQHGRGSRDDAAADDGRAAAPTSLVTAAPPAAAPPVVAPGPQPQATDTSQRSRRCSRYGAAKECNQGGCYWSDDSSTCYVRHVPGSDGTYAQNYQDWWVERVARHNHWDASGGYFLDIGAHSGLWCSNTKLLEERLGWNGVCECNSAAAAAFAAAALSALIPSHTAVVCRAVLAGVEPFPENGPTVGSFVNRTVRHCALWQWCPCLLAMLIGAACSWSCRQCLLVPRALTGTVDGKEVRMDGADAQVGVVAALRWAPTCYCAESKQLAT